MFVWQDGKDLVMGNIEAFAEHIRERFSLPAQSCSTITNSVHQLLRELGEVVQHQKPHAPRTGPGGRFKSPASEQWVIGPAPKKEDT